MTKQYNVRLDRADIGLLTDVLIHVSEQTDILCSKQRYLELINKIQKDWEK